MKRISANRHDSSTTFHKTTIMEYSEEMYEQKLREFFERHDPQKQHLAPDIVEKFPEHQEEVFAYLTKLYAKKHGTEDLNISEETIWQFFPKAHTAG